MIKAEDAVKHFTDEMQEEYKRGERMIDQAIERMVYDVAYVDFAGGVKTPRVLERLRQAYIDGGWVVTLQSGDQRDPGPFLTLRVASPPPQRARVPR